MHNRMSFILTMRNVNLLQDHLYYTFQERFILTMRNVNNSESGGWTIKAAFYLNYEECK